MTQASGTARNNTLVHGGAHNWQYNGRVNVSVLFRCVGDLIAQFRSCGTTFVLRCQGHLILTGTRLRHSHDGGGRWSDEVMVWPAPRIGGYVAVQTWQNRSSLALGTNDEPEEEGVVGVVFENDTCGISFARVALPPAK